MVEIRFEPESFPDLRREIVPQALLDLSGSSAEHHPNPGRIRRPDELAQGVDGGEVAAGNRGEIEQNARRARTLAERLLETGDQRVSGSEEDVAAKPEGTQQCTPVEQHDAIGNRAQLRALLLAPGKFLLDHVHPTQADGEERQRRKHPYADALDESEDGDGGRQ